MPSSREQILAFEPLRLSQSCCLKEFFGLFFFLDEWTEALTQLQEASVTLGLLAIR